MLLRSERNSLWGVTGLLSVLGLPVARWGGYSSKGGALLPAGAFPHAEQHIGCLVPRCIARGLTLRVFSLTIDGSIKSQSPGG